MDAPGITITGRSMIPFSVEAAISATLLQLDDGADENDVVRMTSASGSNSFIASGRVASGSTVSTASLGTMTPGTEFRWGLSYNRLTGGAIFNFNGGTSIALADGVCPIGSAVTTVRFGSRLTTAQLNGFMRYVNGRPFTVSAADLAALTAAA